MTFRQNELLSAERLMARAAADLMNADLLATLRTAAKALELAAFFLVRSRLHGWVLLQATYSLGFPAWQ